MIRLIVPRGTHDGGLTGPKNQPGGRGPIPAVTRISHGEAQIVAGSEASILSTQSLKRDLLAAAVPLELG